ncbi:MAG: hypothetical protein NT075_02690 [Chloroflexi bacterium]|nr:hypothetical protein [Chloroflexota bacterium]
MPVNADFKILGRIRITTNSDLIVLEGFAVQKSIKTLLRNTKNFLWNQKFNSSTYWEKRYAQGGTSGDGSYGQLAQFKANVINQFVREHAVQSVIEYGCGDGNQLQLFTFPSYLGFDVSPTVIQLCQKRYAGDSSKAFKLISDYQGETAPLTLSLDVLYHLVEEPIYTAYLNRLFASAQAYVIIYSTNFDENSLIRTPHGKHRCFTNWVTQNCADWQLVQRIANQYPEASSADFYIYAKS